MNSKKDDNPPADPAIRLRAHHLMCVNGFKGHGYSAEYIKNFWKIFYELKNENPIIEVVDGLDSICNPCPNKGDGICAPNGKSDEDRIQLLDRAYFKTLNLKPGQKLHWSEVLNLIKIKVSEDDFNKNCEPCSWKKLGYCLEALKKIK